MTRLLLADLRRHAGTWTWTVAVAVVTGACVAGQFMVMCGSLDSARATADASMIEAAFVVTTFIIVSVVLAAAAVLTSTSALAVVERERDHGLWRALGMRPIVLRVVVLGQLVVVGVLGSLVGTAAGVLVARLMLPLLIDERVALAGTVPRWEPIDLLWSALIIAGSAMIGGWGAARRAARAPEFALLRGRGDEERHWGPARVLGLLLRLAAVGGVGAGAVSAWLTIRTAGAGSDGAADAAALGSLGVVVLICLLTPWIVPWLQRALAVLPFPGTAWQVAARTAALESRRSSATVLPFFVAIGLVAVLFSGRSLGLASVSTKGFLSMFGLAFVVAWSGGVAVIAMSAGRRRRDAALLRAAGAREGGVLAAQVLEGVLHAFTATLLGLLALAAASPLLAGAAGLSISDALIRAPWAELNVVANLTLVTTCLAVVASSRAPAAAGAGVGPRRAAGGPGRHRRGAGRLSAAPGESSGPAPCTSGRPPGAVTDAGDAGPVGGARRTRRRRPCRAGPAVGGRRLGAAAGPAGRHGSRREPGSSAGCRPSSLSPEEGRPLPRPSSGRGEGPSRRPGPPTGPARPSPADAGPDEPSAPAGAPRPVTAGDRSSGGRSGRSPTSGSGLLPGRIPIIRWPRSPPHPPGRSGRPRPTADAPTVGRAPNREAIATSTLGGAGQGTIRAPPTGGRPGGTSPGLIIGP